MKEAVPAQEISARGAAAIVLLGCRVEPRGRLAGASARRAARAARAFREGAAPLVIASGGVRWKGVVEADALCRELMREGVPRASIVLERRSASTRENARFVAELIREHELELLTHAPFLVVTCDWHMPRALRCFHGVGIAAVALPAPSPEVGALRRLRRSAHEAVKSWVDRAALRGFAAR